MAAEGKNVELLKTRSKSELVWLVAHAFREAPFIPVEKIIGKLEKELQVKWQMLEDSYQSLGVEYYLSMKTCRAYGIKQTGQLKAAFLVVHPLDRPVFIRMSGLFRQALVFLWHLIFNRGLYRKYLNLFPVFSQASRFIENKQADDQHYLELAIIAVLPESQGQGLGRQLLQFLYGLALKENYRGIILATNAANPSFQFYLDEGFKVDREINLEGIRLCWMKKILLKLESEQNY